MAIDDPVAAARQQIEAEARFPTCQYRALQERRISPAYGLPTTTCIPRRPQHYPTLPYLPKNELRIIRRIIRTLVVCHYRIQSKLGQGGIYATEQEEQN